MMLLNQNGVSNGERAGERRSWAHLNLILLTTPDLRKPMNTVGTIPGGGSSTKSLNLHQGSIWPKVIMCSTG